MKHESTAKTPSKVEETVERLRKLLERLVQFILMCKILNLCKFFLTNRNAYTKELLEQKTMKYLKRSDECTIAQVIIKHFIRKEIS